MRNPRFFTASLAALATAVMGAAVSVAASTDTNVALPPFRGHGLCGFLRVRDLA